MEKMNILEVAVGGRDACLLGKLTEVWEESVRVSHKFLCENDVSDIRPYVVAALQGVEHLLAISQGGCYKGFMGIEGDKIEMLFLSADSIGKGLGGRLIDMAVCDYGARYVDVNEQNGSALGFYRYKGFSQIGRDEVDGQGKNFPIIHMKICGKAYVAKVCDDKKRYLDLLLLGDEQESMIDRYLERGEMFALFSLEESVMAGVAVVTDEGDGVCELKNLAISPRLQRSGLGMLMVDYLCQYYRCRFDTMLVGTGESNITTSFYKRCGFKYSHRINDFFTDNYNHPIVEDGVLLRDMVYFSRKLK